MAAPDKPCQHPRVESLLHKLQRGQEAHEDGPQREPGGGPREARGGRQPRGLPALPVVWTKLGRDEDQR